jgi:hypothetical protein
MFPANQPLTFSALNGAAHPQGDEPQGAVRSALHLYDRARTRGWLHRLWSALTRRSSRLLDLSDVEETCTIHNRCYAGIRSVSLGQIRGSDGRCRDFDAAFCPRKNHNKGRWLNVAIARHMGVALPPVCLVQVDDVYFVEDGHHRISVARALGQRSIEAEVVAWQVAGPRPWAASTAARKARSAGTQRATGPVGTS